MKINLKYLDNNHYLISRNAAVFLCKQLDQPLPRLGYERLVAHEGEMYWCKRTIHNGKQVWCLHGPVNKHVTFYWDRKERINEDE